MAQYGEWNKKGATLSDVSAQKEYGISRDFIIKGIDSGHLEYREGSIWGNPYLRVLRSQLEKYIYGNSYSAIEQCNHRYRTAKKSARIRTQTEASQLLQHGHSRASPALYLLERTEYRPAQPVTTLELAASSRLVPMAGTCLPAHINTGLPGHHIPLRLLWWICTTPSLRAFHHDPAKLAG